MKKFYDAHCHIMNLSHPNLSVVLKRILNESNAIRKIGISIGVFLSSIPFIGSTIQSLLKVDNKAMNLLAIMETELGDFILQMEEDLRKEPLSWSNGPVLSGDGRYDKIVLTPLIMDFGLKGYEKDETRYKVRWKPIIAQVLDLCLGIKYYYEYIQKHSVSAAKPRTPLFEIYPFMGINTKNYEMERQNPNDPLGLKDLLPKYFDGFAGDTTDKRCKNLAERNWLEFTGDPDTIKPYDFIGIKVYPPLGYNPWPTATWGKNWEYEREKVCYLYEFCQNNNIPITAHCSDGGFLADKKYAELANPNKWAEVLFYYPKLRLNLAHFGADNKTWRETIAGLVLRYDNVYTDISYRGVDKKYYDVLKKFIDSYSSDDRKKLMKKIIFGSDFMVNLMAIESYSAYMEHFANTSAFTVEEKDWFCSKNPERFLFLTV